MDDELLDWEVLHGSDTESITSDEKSKSSSVFDDGMILSDHFSATDLTQSGLIEPGVGYVSEESPVVVDLGDTCVRNELGIYDSKIGVSGYGDFVADDDVESQSKGNELVSGDSEIVNGEEEILSTEEVEAVRYGGDSGEVRLSDFEAGDVKNLESKCLSESDEIEVVNGRHFESKSNFEEPIEDLSKSLSDSGGNEMVSGDSGIVNGEEEIVSAEEVEAVRRCGDESESKSKEIVWWKMPFVLLKYSVFKIGPVWSVSMAAAVMGLVLLGRRLYNIKKKAQSFHLKVTIDDKKVSRVMSQAARLNEVFTEVRRVPVIRSALPSPVAWPVLSLR